jgi:glycosyltransferase involved in cell wall biosynthesis/MoaA/NifB/PqqE/SkfB family radical SAM enzyme
MPGESSHQAGLKLFAEGQHGAALGEFARAISEEETGDRWNDWATAESAYGREVRAEWGYRRALRLDSAHRRAALNLATLLITQRRPAESVVLVTPHAQTLSKSERGSLANLIMKSSVPGAPTTPAPALNPQAVLDAFLTIISLIPNDDPTMPADLRALNRSRVFDSRHYVEQCYELFKALPPEVQPLAVGKLKERSECDFRGLLVLACRSLAHNDPQTALSLAWQAIEVRPYDLYAQRVLIQAELAVTPEDLRAQHPRAGLEEYLANSFCGEPWTHFMVQSDGGVYLCCSGWLVPPIGNAYSSSAQEIWNSPVAQALRASILDGSFRYCGRVNCAQIASRNLPRREAAMKNGSPSLPCIFLGPYPPGEAASPPSPQASDSTTAFPLVCREGPRDINLAHDSTCNLACPQCRRDFCYGTRAKRDMLDNLLQRFLSSGLLKNARSLRINDGGDVFASKHCRNFLKELKPELYPNLTLVLITNGQLCNRKAFEDLHLWGRLSSLDVSVDAATEETYRVLRRGGDFKRLLANLEFLDSIRIHEGEKFALLLRFVVSALNFRELPAFIDLARRFHAHVDFNFLRNHGTFPSVEFKQLNIANPSHPHYAEFLSVLEAEQLADPRIIWGNLGYLRPPAAAFMRRQQANRQKVGAEGSPSAQPTADLVPSGAKPSHTQPDISVIIPTFNRCGMLASCLNALEQQALAKERFEVIVVDDGSSDETGLFCRELSVPFRLVYLRQRNAGAGAARKLGSEAARGKYILLFNDDTMATPDLLAEHLRAQQEHGQEKCAVLGHFRYPPAAVNRALTCFFATRSFLFPQISMQRGTYRAIPYFITCNLSILREAVSQVGSFDPQFRVAEDTELGVRLDRIGYGVWYHPEALAWHDHLVFTAADLVKRARGYAPANFRLCRKHPWLLGPGTGAFGKLDADWAAKTRDLLDQSRRQITDWTQTIASFDQFNFAPLFSRRKGELAEAELVLRAFDEIVPRVHMFHLLDGMLKLWEQEEEPSALSYQQAFQRHARDACKLTAGELAGRLLEGFNYAITPATNCPESSLKTEDRELKADSS